MTTRAARLAVAGALLAAASFATSAQADWKPTKTIEFVVTGGPGGGTDQFARTVQAAITKNKLADVSLVVVNKGGGSGAEGFIQGKMAAGEPHKLIFGTSNEWMLPMVAKLAFAPADLKPVAAMAFDEFILWGKPGTADAAALLASAKAAPGDVKMGGSQSKDVDQLLTRLLEKAASVKFIYVPFKSGNEAAVQLSGGHIDANTNNPSESVGQWKAGTVRPLCVFSPKRMAAGAKVTATEAGATCRPAAKPAYPSRSTGCPGPCSRRLASRTRSRLTTSPFSRRCGRRPSGATTSSGPPRPTGSSTPRRLQASSPPTRRGCGRSSRTKAGW
jgi:putative tricarboxylic transport membrane protein